MDKLSYLSNADPAMIDELYSQYRRDASTVDDGWRRFFEGFEFSQTHYDGHYEEQHKDEPCENYPCEFKVFNLINGYRERGHLFTKTNPVRTRRQYRPTLDIENFGLTSDDLDRKFAAGNEIGIGEATLKEIINHLEQTYCASVGVEYMFIREVAVQAWLRANMERTKNTVAFSDESKVFMLKKLARAVNFEKFIHKRFPGQKRFSLEGAEALIPALDAVIERGAALGTREFVIGMPHRGRLNVLANIMHKKYSEIFSEFAGKEYDDEHLLGDVKYHLGSTCQRQTDDGQKIDLTLVANPSHLETVNPVVEGIVRAKIDNRYEGDFKKVAPILIHGDASIAGQGIVYEVLQMSQLPGYKTGGTIHIVVNNQVGFTTNYLDARSSTYCTDVAKVVQSPVFHVNGDDVEAMAYTIRFAMEFRDKFQRDIFIDLLCYRKYGHNEGDEPRFTQPLLYKIIENHPNPMEIYANKLLGEGVINKEKLQSFEDDINNTLEENLEESKHFERNHISFFLGEHWGDIKKATTADFDTSPETGVDISLLKDISKKITALPEDKTFYRKIVKLQQDRYDMVFKENRLDWAMGELLAYATLLNEGRDIRLSGQDSERGTFSHRHAVLRVEDSEERYIPLHHISDKQARFEVYNSLLSEYGVLGFEYGYSLESPSNLTIWEAQFGDFNNGAQIIIDQYLSSAEDKWNVMNDLVLLLPHGYEGQGPEHSSARIERFLTLCAENNMQLINPTTPANFFHVLRRQFYRDFRKPLIVFTPKSLLRHPQVVSPIEDLANGKFQEVIDDAQADPKKITRVVFCSGKLYYDLLEERKKKNIENTALIRLEQLYPLPTKQLIKIIDKYHKATDHIWSQEEPVNMGAWYFMGYYFPKVDLRVVARPASGSPATGSSRFHAVRQQKIIDKSFAECDCPAVDEECRMVCIGNRWKSFAKDPDKVLRANFEHQLK
ncbi:MAG TPA: 2-oxoglutarate dehydrogenase E1 component [Bacteroidales bacterium]|nr:2-oxoglutarate dehydrogenase E1 component [Bacteroidales bacterium]